jgi:hypothetical protein
VTRASADLARRVCWLALAIGLLWAAGSARAGTAPGLKTVRYHGYAVRVPASWAVIDLATTPRACVRFDRRAVYLGVPGSQQACPAHAAGRARALLLEPAGGTVRRITSAAQTRTAAGPTAGGPAAHATSGPTAHAASVYTGLGFDACSTPSTRTMSAWSSSPYRGIGVYIGGVNSACSQGNLNRSWVATEVSAGWHLIPIYVGLQAPSNSCGCSGITPSRAGAQGTAAAEDAIGDAQGVGIPSGNPIYYDMEAYPNGGATTTAVMTFLSAWTAALHAKGYVSGVYSSASSGISDLASRYHTGYLEPDDLWIADWNGRKSTSDPYVPSSDWSNHQRLHQYSGSHNERYGGITLNIDGDYLDGATAGTSGHSVPPPAKPPTLSVSPASDGTTSISASWSGGRGLTAWRVLAGESTSGLSSVGGARAHGTRALIKLANGSPYFAVQALGSGGKVLATSKPAAAPAHLAVFGRSAFVSLAGTGGLPTGCYSTRACHIATTVRVGGVTVATTGTESIHSGSTGLLYFTLNATGRFMLANSRGGRLPVQISLRDTGGSKATVALSLVGFATTGAVPARTPRKAPPVQILGTTDFVPAHGLGGILASCSSPTPCHIAATITVGGTTVAKTGTETIGGKEAGYVFFPLSAHGRGMLTQALGNHLQAELALSAGTSVARGTIALVAFG